MNVQIVAKIAFSVLNGGMFGNCLRVAVITFGLKRNTHCCKSLAPNRCRIDKLLTVNSPVAAPPCVTQVVFTCQGDAVNCMRI